MKHQQPCKLVHNLKRPSGFTLIEILIAVVIISIGLLGMAGIQLKGLRGTHSASLKGQATIVANDIAERIHANLGGAPSDDNALPAVNTRYANVDSSQLNCNVAPTYCSDNSSGEANNNCTPVQMATYDVFVWACGDTNNDGTDNSTDNDGLVNLLPGGTATISCTDIDAGLVGADAIFCTPGSTLNITVNWNEVSPTDGSALVRNVSLNIVP